MKIVKIIRWGTSKLQCIKAVKDLMGLTLRDAKEMVENSEMPCVLKVCDSEKLKTFTSYTQEYCHGMNYTVEDCNEDSDHDVDVANHKTISRTDLVEGFISAMNNICVAISNANKAFNALIGQNDEIGNRYNNVCAEASLLQAEVEKLKANNNNDLCIQLREEIACLKHDCDVLREEKKVVEGNNDSLMIANKSLQEDVQRLKEIHQEIKNLTL